MSKKAIRINNLIVIRLRKNGGSAFRYWKKIDFLRCQCKNEGIALLSKKDHEAHTDILRRFAKRSGIDVGTVDGASRKGKKRYTKYDGTNGFTEWRQLRYKALKRAGGRCECCGATPATSGEPLHVDHIKPKSIYPKLALELGNLQVLCADCNIGKGNWDETNWREKRLEFEAEKELDMQNIVNFRSRTK